MTHQPIIIAYGDGVGPEIMEAALLILRETRAPITIAATEMGEQVYKMQYKTGILPSLSGLLLRSRIILKAPTLKPEPHGYPHPDPLPEGAIRYRDATEALCEMLELDGRYCARLNIKHSLPHTDEAPLPWFAATASIGERYALFEPLHGPAPQRAGDSANPCGMIQAMLMMLEHIQLEGTACSIRSAVEEAWREGLHTPDMQSEHTRRVLGTREWAEAVAENLASASFSGQNSGALH